MKYYIQYSTKSLLRFAVLLTSKIEGQDCLVILRYTSVTTAMRYTTTISK